ncbi:MAG: hypothetical protein OEV89_07420 [Desulfobulbaceae bacterium]|nr:hypothetical protein [Desulfobulbaceae bacterium]HIJ90582.1 hypothetical protein [Deltaproteobacteria bacterium]
MKSVPAEEKELESSIDVIRALYEIKNMRDLLRKENAKYRREIEAVTAELDGLAVIASETDEYIAGYAAKRETVLARIEKMPVRQTPLAENLNFQRMQLKAVNDDLENSSSMLETMAGELENIKNEKEIMISRLKAIDTGIQGICKEKESKLPTIMGHDKVLKKAYRVFKDAENRMEVAIQFRSSPKRGGN